MNDVKQTALHWTGRWDSGGRFSLKVIFIGIDASSEPLMRKQEDMCRQYPFICHLTGGWFVGERAGSGGDVFRIKHGPFGNKEIATSIALMLGEGTRKL